MDEKAVVGSSKTASPQFNFNSDLLRQKAICFEKNYRGRLTKGDIKEKVTLWESMAKGNSLKAQLGSVSVSSSVEINEQNDNQSTQVPVLASPAVNNSSSTTQKVEIEDPTDYCDRVDSALQRYLATDENDRSPLMLLPLKVLLERDLEGWTNWANKKIMQVAQKLRKDQTELKELRQEREEVEKSIRGKQSYDESTVKQPNEMEHALGNVNRQIELAKCTLHSLEFENSVLVKEMEKAKTEACRSAARLQEEKVKESDAVKKAQACETEKGLVQQRLTSLRRKNVEGEKQLWKAKNRLNQFKALLKQEQEEELNVKKQYDVLRAKIEAEDAVMKVEADNIIQTGQMIKQKCEDDIKNLETMISELKLESNKIKIAALNSGYGPNIQKQVSKVPKRLAVFQDIVKGEHVKLERVCVMCRTEEISVVFIPCAHQVLCRTCNVLHEKQGMNDCPSCRATIDQRVVSTFRPN